MTECIQIPEILLPTVKDLSKWSVIACDQFTSDRDYWEKVRETVGQNPSALDLILPEVYLRDGGVDARISSIHQKMKDYLKDGILRKLAPGFILVERRTNYSAEARFGLMLAVNLDNYSYGAGEKSLVRATEETVEDRIPSRVKARRGAALELPHAMLLYNDKQNAVLGDVIASKNSFETLYDFELNMDGGRVKGYYIPYEKSLEIRERFYDLVGRKALDSRIKTDALLFAVGDGNHSLAAAKDYWEEKKEYLNDEKKSNVAKYALVEVVNLYDKALTFQPIYRFIHVTNREKFLYTLESYTTSYNRDGGIVSFAGHYDIPDMIRKLDNYAKAYIEVNGGSLDFIYGEEELRRLVANTPESVGVILNPIDKSNFFDYIKKEGSLPQKAFSMGKGPEKRYYLECKEI